MRPTKKQIEAYKEMAKTSPDSMKAMIEANLKATCDKYAVTQVLDKLCWTPTIAAKAIGMKSRNTILNWVKKTRRGEMDMPFLGGRTKGALVFIPVREFLDWYGYAGQN